MTNRALVLAALADAPSVIDNPLRARDTDLMAAGLRVLGAQIDAVPGGSTAAASDPTDSPGAAASWRVTPAVGLADGRLDAGPAGPGPKRYDEPRHVDVGVAGTVMRFLPPVAALRVGATSFDGDERSHARPMAALTEALRDLGVEVDGDAMPLVVAGTGQIAGGPVTLDASSSSQLLSALLLPAARFADGLDVRHHGPALPSRPHIEMTVQMLRAAGIDVEEFPGGSGEVERWRVAPGPIRALHLTMEPDLSGAAPFLAAAVVTGGEVTVVGWPAATTQAGDLLRAVLTAFGADVHCTATGLTVRGGGRVRPVDLDLRACSELAPVVAAICAVADGPSTLSGIGHVRGHETDRIAALATELAGLGATVSETEGGLRIEPRPLTGRVVATYGDHRMAHAAAVLGLAVDGVRVRDVATTAKTMPDFVDRWTDLVGGVR